VNASSVLFSGTALTITIADVVDAVIALTLVEAAALLLFHRWRGAAANRGLAPGEIGLNLLSGLCLMAALHFAVRGFGGPWIAACLLAAGVAHGADLLRRWQRSDLRVGPVRVATGTAARGLTGR